MIRTLTIVEHISENGMVNYTINGELPLDEAAKALVIVAFNAIPPVASTPVVRQPVAAQPVVDKQTD